MDVFIQNALHGTVSDQFVQRTVDFIQKFGVVLRDGNGVILSRGLMDEELVKKVDEIMQNAK